MRTCGRFRSMALQRQSHLFARMPPKARRSFRRIRRALLAGIDYTSNESGRDEVQLRTFPDAQNRLIVSSDGGHSPKWRRDGKELFSVAADGTVMAVAVSDNPLHLGPPIPLFQTPRGFDTGIPPGVAVRRRGT